MRFPFPRLGATGDAAPHPSATQPPPGADIEPSADAAEPGDAFRCSYPREVLELLRQLQTAGSPVALSAPDGSSLSATLLTLDADRERLVFDVEASSPQLPGLVDSNEVSAVAFLDSVKLQFDLQDLLLVRNQKKCALHAALPQRLWRFQRRAAFRVRTLERSSPTATLRHPSLPDMRLTLRVLDVSASGCALLLPNDVPPLPLGALVQGVRFALDTDTRFDGALRLQHVTSIAATDAGARLGCELQALEPSAARTLQRYIDGTQKRRRLLALD